MSGWHIAIQIGNYSKRPSFSKLRRLFWEKTIKKARDLKIRAFNRIIPVSYENVSVLSRATSSFFSGKKRFWKIRIMATPTKMEASAILKIGHSAV